MSRRVRQYRVRRSALPVPQPPGGSPLCLPSYSPARGPNGRGWAVPGSTIRRGRSLTTPRRPPAETSATSLLDAPFDELTETRNAQLATFTFSLLITDAVERLGIEPTEIAGHSLGEYSALAVSGALGFEDGVRLVAERGEAMQSAADARPGVMTVVAGCDADTVDIACRLADGDVWVANYNSAEETVIAGEPAAVDKAAAGAMELGARKVSPVAVGGAFHTPFMAPARDRLRKMMATITFHDAEVPIVANVDARRHTSASDWEVLLLAQLREPDPLAPEHPAPRRPAGGRAMGSACSWSSGPVLRCQRWCARPCRTSRPWPCPHPGTSTAWSTPYRATLPSMPTHWATRANTSTCPSGW